MYAKPKRKKQLGSYPYFTVVFSITLALFTLGVFGLLLSYGKNLSDSIQNNHQIQVYLDKDLSKSQIKHIETQLNNKNFTNEISFTSKEQAKSKFISEDNNDPEKLLGFNPLRDYFNIVINKENSNTASLEKIKKETESIKGVFEVEFLEDFINIINENVQKIGVVILGICLILVLIVFILINNTIKLALFSQRFIIRSMQLVGATAWFIQKPFLWRAIWQGLLSGWIACTLLFSLSQYAKDKVEDLALIENIEHIFIIFAILVIVGALIGFLSSYRAVKKYLKLSLDELY